MDFNQFESIARVMYIEKLKRFDYLDTLPTNISDFIIDDCYSNSLNTVIDTILATVMPIEHYDCLMWFLYDWKVGYSVIMDDGTKYIINNIDDYISFKQETWTTPNQ